MRVRFALTVLVALLISPFATSVQAQDAPGDGGTYTSPTYGYVIAWPAEWTVEEESSEGGYDLLHIATPISDLYFEGFVDYGGDLATCLDQEAARLAREQGVSDVETVAESSVETGDGILIGLNRTFTFSLEGDDGTESVTQHTECRTLPGAGVLVITHYALSADYESEKSKVRALTAGITMPGQLAVGGQQSANLDALLASAESDLNAFWTSELPRLGGKYTAPAYITFSEPIDTGCGSTDPGSDGPFYCADDRTVYLDLTAFEEEILPYGGFVAEFTVAHETGHHIQEMLHLKACDVSSCPGGYTNLQFELMADCFGGAWARDAKARGEVADGDVDKAVIALAAYFGDPPNTPANDPDAHGPGNLRTWWFLQGYYEGAASCLTANDESSK